MPDIAEFLRQAVISTPAILFGLTIHEFSHGYVAWKLGDPTARSLGRLTLNPLKHLDLVGTAALFLFHFGWAKPVPIDPGYFRYPTRDLALSSLAGPAANFLTALGTGLVTRLFYLLNVTGFPLLLVTQFVFYNLVLCFFNLLPIPPLDGSRLVYYFLPPELAARYAGLERYGFILLLALIFAGQLAGVSLLGLYLAPLVRIFSLLFAGQALM